ncbi:MAG TPA: tetratricopeptide repeat protein [Lacunisphaera sp.]|nr:tetratricopeptide repeat protein [Lacunisphaera sp.]
MSAKSQPSAPPARPPRATGRLWFFRLFTALVIPVFLLLLFEGGLRLVGFGQPANFLIPDKNPAYLRTNPGYISLFLPGSFDLRPLNYRIAAKKPANAVRIVVLGESAAQGIPVPSFAFAPQLRALLRARYPGKTIEVVNTGVVAINSHVVYQIARDVARYEPDLFVVYMGNNEVVGPYGPGCSYLSDMKPLWSIRLGLWIQKTRTGQFVSAGLAKLASFRSAPPEWGGMAMFMDHAVRGDDPRLQKVYQNFERNLRDIVRVASEAGAQTLLCTVVSNVKDCPPFLSLHRPDLTADQLASWQRAYDAGRVAWKLGETADARAALNQAWQLDPQYADTAFMLGDLDLQAGDVESARRWFLAAQKWDALRFRPDPRLNEIVRAVAGAFPGTRLVDTARELGSDPASTLPPAGRELLFEHVHLDWEGNHRLAQLMAAGAGAALFKDGSAAPPWLDSAGCAAALGYTPAERFGVLQRAALITRYPPFPNQLTYAFDQARAARELAAAQSIRRDPAALRRAQEVVTAALQQDPDNADLTKLAVELADDRGDLPGALEQVRRGQALQPDNFALIADEAIKLGRLGRHDEAEKRLLDVIRIASPRDQLKLSAVFADFYLRTKRYAEGRRWFDDAVIQQSKVPALRLFRARLEQASGELQQAERDYREMLALDPASDGGLEALVSLLTLEGRAREAEDLSVTYLGDQPGNQENQLRAARILEARGQPEAAAQALQAALHSGALPVPVHLHLVNLIYKKRRDAEVLDHLATAWRLATTEGDNETAASIRELIHRIRKEGTRP